MLIPFLDLKMLNKRYERQFSDALARVLESGRFISGDEVAKFESEFAAWSGVKHCIGTGNGLDSLSLIFRAYLELGQINPGDEVILPANSFIATALAVSNVGLKPVLVDVDPTTHNISVESVVCAISKKTAAILPVHLYGRLADMLNLKRVADEFGLLLIEDAAQAHGASCGGKMAGSFGDAAAFSFFPGKNLGALGDAGAVLTNNSELADCIRSIGNYGSRQKYQHQYKGVNSRLDELQASFLRVKLDFFDDDLAARSNLALHYLNNIRNPGIILPSPVSGNEKHAWHLFVIRSAFRDKLKEYLASHGIETLIHYPVPIHLQQAYKEEVVELPVSESHASEVLSLPLYPAMKDRDLVVSACNAFMM